MKLLFLAPQPFFQERGTPIAVRLALQVLAERLSLANDQERIDLLSYAEGLDVQIQGVQNFRIWQPALLRKVGPGISFKKIICDLIFLIQALKLAWLNRQRQYDLVHAVEESVFIAWLINLFFKVPYIYDMDSSLALQLTEKWFLLKPFYPIFSWIEKRAVLRSLAVVPVCDALAAIARKHGSRFTSVLSDVSLLNSDLEGQAGDLRAELGLNADSALIMYIGNLERYQGIDLLLDAFAKLESRECAAQLVIIGGNPVHIAAYQENAKKLGVAAQVHFLGPRPLSSLDGLIKQATILVSPRIKGNNTPMKIYSYLHSGVPIVATDLFTHTQVLNSEIALLAKADAASFASGLNKLLAEQTLREQIGAKAKSFAERRYTFEVFKTRLNEIYDHVALDLSASIVKGFS